MKLYSYWRSSASYRVRIALYYKGFAFDTAPVNLLEGDQRGDDYGALNPQRLVPTLVADDGAMLNQSQAIVEYLEEIKPEPTLLPGDAATRAKARGIAAILACETQPLQNLRVQQYLKTEMEQPDDVVKQWMSHWVGKSLTAVEGAVESAGGPYCIGEAVSIADVFLVPQLYSAERFGIDLAPYPVLRATAEQLNALDAFVAAHPDNQPDAPKT